MIPTTPTAPTTPTKSLREIKDMGGNVAGCMLDNSALTVVGVFAGLGIFFRTKVKRHFLIAVTFGTVADLFVGYYGTCRPLREDYEACRAAYDLANPAAPSPPSFLPKINFPQFANLSRDYTTTPPEEQRKQMESKDVNSFDESISFDNKDKEEPKI